MADPRVDVLTSAGAYVCRRCPVATSFRARLRGLMGAAQLEPLSGLLLPRTRSIHTHFMRFPIDVLFLDSEQRIVKIVAGLRPWRAAAATASTVLELAAGECARLRLAEGDVLQVRRDPAA